MIRMEQTAVFKQPDGFAGEVRGGAQTPPRPPQGGPRLAASNRVEQQGRPLSPSIIKSPQRTTMVVIRTAKRGGITARKYAFG